MCDFRKKCNETPQFTETCCADFISHLFRNKETRQVLCKKSTGEKLNPQQIVVNTTRLRLVGISICVLGLLFTRLLYLTSFAPGETKIKS